MRKFFIIRKLLYLVEYMIRVSLPLYVKNTMKLHTA